MLGRVHLVVDLIADSAKVTFGNQAPVMLDLAAAASFVAGGSPYVAFGAFNSSTSQPKVGLDDILVTATP